jgi:hypothetical protein
LIGAYERILDFGGSVGKGNIIISRRVSSSDLNFITFSTGNSSQATYNTLANAIVQDQWMVVSVRMSSSLVVNIP